MSKDMENAGRWLVAHWHILDEETRAILKIIGISPAESRRQQEDGISRPSD